MYITLAYISSSLVILTLSNPWLRLVGTYVIIFLPIDRYVSYKETKNEAASRKQRRNRILAEYLGEPVQVEGDVSAIEVKDVKDIEEVSVPKARKGPSTRRRG